MALNQKIEADRRKNEFVFQLIKYAIHNFFQQRVTRQIRTLFGMDEALKFGL